MQGSDEVAKLRAENEELRAVRQCTSVEIEIGDFAASSSSIVKWHCSSHVCLRVTWQERDEQSVLRDLDWSSPRGELLVCLVQVALAALGRLSKESRAAFFERHEQLRAQGSALGEKLPQITREGVLDIVQEGSRGAGASMVGHQTCLPGIYTGPFHILCHHNLRRHISWALDGSVRTTSLICLPA